MKDTLKELRSKAEEQGFITFDEILDTAERHTLDLSSIETITGSLLDEKIIILENRPAQVVGGETVDYEHDNSQLDYESIFDNVLSLAPELSCYIDSVRAIPPPRPGEEHRLIASAQEGNPYAAERLTRMFLKVVIRLALTYHQRYGLPLEDAIQDGNTGLIISIEKYKKKPERRFSSYAPWWIQRSIMRYSEGMWLPLYTPYYVKDNLLKLCRYLGPGNLQANHYDIEDVLSFDDTDDIEDKTGIEGEKIREYLDFFKHPRSTDEILEFSDEAAWERRLEEDVASRTVFEAIMHSIENGELNDKLSERERHILKLRFGLNGDDAMTYQEIGDCLGITRERVRQLLKECIRSIQRAILPQRSLQK